MFGDSQFLTKSLSQLFAQPLFHLSGQAITLVWLLKLLALLLAVTLLTRAIKSALKHRLLGKLGIDPGNREALATLISYAIGAIGYVIVIQASGFDLATFAVIIGGLGVGIGFGLQDITKNLVSGLTLLMERKLKVGDFIEFEEIAGYVEEISIRAAVVRTLSGEEVIIPNSQLVENRITNKSYNSFNGRITLPVGVAYGSDPVLVTEVLLNSAYMAGEILRLPAPKVIFEGFGDSALNFLLWVWVDRIDREVPIRSNLNFIIEHNLRAAGITIPFPQQDLWLRNPEALARGTAMPAEIAEPESAPSPALPQPFLRDLLQQVTYFQSWNDLHLRSLIEMGYRQHLTDGEILCHAGEPGRTFFIVLTGAIEAISERGQRQKQLFVFKAGEFFGELPLMLGVPYPTTMRALSDTLLFAINRDGFGQLLERYPELAETIVQELANRREVLAGYHRQLKELGLEDAADGSKNPVVWLRQRLKTLFSSLQ